MRLENSEVVLGMCGCGESERGLVWSGDDSSFSRVSSMYHTTSTPLAEPEGTWRKTVSVLRGH